MENKTSRPRHVIKTVITKDSNVTDLRHSLLENYHCLQEGTLPDKIAKELTNNAGKVLNSAKLQMEYNQLMNVQTPINFLVGS